MRPSGNVCLATVETRRRDELGAAHEPRALLLLVSDGAEHVVGRLTADTPDLALVGALARLQLAAKQRGCSIRLVVSCEKLAALIELAGLTDVLAVEPKEVPG